MANFDRLTFLAEWDDPISSVTWKFHLFVYPDETVELYDLHKRRLFLKRIRCEGITMDDIFVGATLRICSRQIKITDYADTYSRSKMESFVQKTCGFIKPEAMDRKGEILESLTDSNLKIINIRMVQFTEQQTTSILEEYDDHSIIGALIDHVTSKPVLCFQLLGEDSVSRLLKLAGPEDPLSVCAEQLHCLRKRFGIDKMKNGLYVSGSAERVRKDSDIMFNPERAGIQWLPPVFSFNDTFCCVIKPHAVREGNIGNIMRIIEESGYNITGAFMTILTIDQAEKFHEVYKSIVPEYMDMVKELCSGPCLAMEIKGKEEKDTHEEFRKLVGPMDPDICKLIRPNTIRARFGKNKSQNGVHATDLTEDGLLEVAFFFKGPP